MLCWSILRQSVFVACNLHGNVLTLREPIREPLQSSVGALPLLGNSRDVHTLTLRISLLFTLICLHLSDSLQSKSLICFVWNSWRALTWLHASLFWMWVKITEKVKLGVWYICHTGNNIYKSRTKTKAAWQIVKWECSSGWRWPTAQEPITTKWD